MNDEVLYEAAAREIASGSPQRGLFAKAFAQADGDENKTRAFYIKERVIQLKGQLAEETERKDTVKQEAALPSTQDQITHAQTTPSKPSGFISWSAISKWTAFRFLAAFALVPLFLRPPNGGFPGVGVAPKQFLLSWIALIGVLYAIGAVIGLVLYLILRITVGKTVLTKTQFIFFGALIYLCVEVCTKPVFYILCGNQHAWFFWW